jgi:HEAT repeat protein
MGKDRVTYKEIEQEVTKMQSSNAQTREEGIQKVRSISEAIGKAATLHYMLPFLRMLLDTNERIKGSMIGEIDGIVRHVLGTLGPALPIYKEILLSRDEEVRERAVESLVGEHVDLQREGRGPGEKSFEAAELVVFLRELAASRFVMHRISAIVLVKELLEKASEMHEQEAGMRERCMEQVRGIYGGLRKDASPFVRRRAVVPFILRELYTREELEAFTEDLISDKEDCVRALFPVLIEASETDSPRVLSSVLTATAGDQSWAVRLNSVKILVRAFRTLYAGGGDREKERACKGLEALVGDKEHEVRRSAVSVIHEIAETVPEIRSRLFSILKKASRDESSNVRESVGGSLSLLAARCGKEEVEMCIFPVMKMLLCDRDRATKMSVIRSLGVIYEKLGPDAITDALSPIISDLSSTNWRIRCAVLKSISALGRKMGREYFSANLAEHFFKVFSDQVSSVREEGALLLRELAREFGPVWFAEVVLPSLEPLRGSRRYLHRISYLNAISVLSLFLDASEGEESDRLYRQTVPLIEGFVDDRIDEVRMALARNLKSMAHASDSRKRPEDGTTPLPEGMYQILARLRIDKSAVVSAIASSVPSRGDGE